MAKLVLWNDDLKSQYKALFCSCVIRQTHLAAVDFIVEKLSSNQKRYEYIAKQIGCPWWFVGIIHYIECGFRFGCHLHNGDPLTARTVHVPEGRPIGGSAPFTFEASAIDALKLKHFNDVANWSIEHALFLLEGYNGFGYRQYHPSVLTPYLWSYTNHYDKGKYVADGKFDPNCVSQQCGLAAVLKRANDRNVIKLQ